MLDSARFPGITNVLATGAQFNNVIHGDLYSDCHVIPIGTADPVHAMRAADRLPIILESLTSAYDLVVIECGVIDANGIRRLVGENTEILVSVLEPGKQVTAAAEDLAAGGYEGFIMVTPAGYDAPNFPRPCRSVA
jgi:Mrp family chromosome partitioning ATPase